MNRRVIASALIRRGDQFLFIRQNKQGGAYPGTLHIPGGGIEEGETPLSAVIREVREEVGLQLVSLEPIDFDWDVVEYENRQTLLIFLRFTAEALSGEARASSDAEHIVWVAADELASQRHNSASLRFMKKLKLI